MSIKSEFLKTPIEHVDITRDSVVPIVEAMGQMAYSARDLYRAATIYDRMLRDRDCGVILCLAGSLISAGLKRVFADMIRNHMVDAIVSTGANIVDQDFFEALGFKHWMAEDRFKYGLDDDKLREMHIDRIYDTLIDEDELRVCDETIHKITDSLEPRPYSSREFVGEMGKYLGETGAKTDASNVRDGALSGSTLKEASSWGKVDTTYEQMVYCEATIAVPLIVGYAYHKRGWEGRTSRKWSSALDKDQV